MHYLRLIYILWIALWFRLDDFIEQKSGIHPLQALIKLCFFWRSKKQARGVRLRLALEKLGPIFVKFGQVLSTRRDLLPEVVANELAKLQDQVPPIDYTLIEQTITDAFNQPLNTIYAEFDQVCIASASVAQVHFARLLSGEEVAVKVLRPNIGKVIEQDLAILKSLACLVQLLSSEGKRLKPLEIVEEFARHTKHELDLTLEAANCSQLKRNFSHHSGDKQLLIPNVYWDYCRKSVMTMERMHGTSVRDTTALIAKNICLSQLAHDGVEIFFTQVFEHNFFHADMHPGNIFVNASNPQKPSYIAIDCAIMGSLSKDDQYYMARNLIAIFKRDYRQVAELHIRSGWVPSNTPVNEFTGAIRAVCEPIFQRPLNEISLGHMLISLFTTARRFNMEVQPSLVLLQKTLLNIEGLGRQLYPQLDLWATAQPFLDKWLKERYSAKNLFKQFKRFAPDWLEQLPEIPPLIYNALQTLQQKNSDNNSAPEVANNAKAILPKTRKWFPWVGGAALGAGLCLAFPQWADSLLQLPHAGLALIAAGLLALLLR